jgi:hypothetical protein
MPVPLAPIRVPCQWSLGSSVTSVTSNDKDNNHVKSGNVHRSPGIYLMAEENIGESQLEDHPMKAV